MDKRVIVITGPTATGKTALSVALAEKLDGEIISADSMQIYRGMDIGTAKVSPEDLAASPTTWWTLPTQGKAFPFPAGWIWPPNAARISSQEAKPP